MADTSSPPFDPNAPFSEPLAEGLGFIPYLRNLPVQVKKELISASVLHHYESGQVIYLEGEPASAVYFLVSGRVKSARITSAGREQIMNFLKPGEIFGDIAVFSGTPYPATVIALEPTAAGAITASTLVELMRAYPDLSLAILHKMSSRVLHYLDLVEDLSLRSVEARLAKWLLQKAVLDDGQMTVTRQKWDTIESLATHLGTVRDVLGRAMKKLSQDGLIQASRKKIIILDVKGLVRRAAL